MRTTITFNGKVFIEANNTKVRLAKAICKCGNKIIAPKGVFVLGIVTDCAHCNKVYPLDQHCKTLIASYTELIEEGGSVSLD